MSRVWFVVEEMVLRKVFLGVLMPCPIVTNPPTLHTNSSIIHGIGNGPNLNRGSSRHGLNPTQAQNKIGNVRIT